MRGWVVDHYILDLVLEHLMDHCELRRVVDIFPQGHVVLFLTDHRLSGIMNVITMGLIVMVIEVMT